MPAGVQNAVPFTVRLAFDSDWSVGTGAGRHASVDSATRRDKDGLPAFGGKGLVNLLRDAAQTIAGAFDKDCTGEPWGLWVTALFGSEKGGGPREGSAPVPAAILPPTLRLPSDVSAAVVGTRVDGRPLGDFLYVQRASVSLGERRTAREDHLRLAEIARAGLELEARWTVAVRGLAAGQPLPVPAEVLLLASARWIERAGGKRRRGLGRCQVTLAGADWTGSSRLTELLLRLDIKAAEPPPHEVWAPAPTAPAASNGIQQDATHAPLAHACNLRITLASPVVVDAGLMGNLVRTHDFIPGTMLLPLVRTALTASGPGHNLGDLVGAGAIRVTDATLEIAGQRGLPAPRALQQERGALLGSDLTVITDVRATQLRRPAAVAGYLAEGAGGVRVGAPTRINHVHGTIDDLAQRPLDDGVFVYQGISAGTVLRAELHLAADVTVNWDAILGEQLIGRSKKDDYGDVIVEVLEVEERSPEDGNPRAGPAEELTVWLTSDLVLLDEHGRADATVAGLAAALSLELRVDLEPYAIDVDARPRELVTVRRRESWQSGWGLPRPSIVALAAGSVLKLRLPGQAPAIEVLERVERNGLGHRRAEGFGCVRFNPPLLSAPLVTVTNPAPATPEHERAQAVVVGASWWPAVNTAVWRTSIRDALFTWTRDIDHVHQLVPKDASRAQLGALRQIGAIPAGTRERLGQWLTQLQASDKRWDAWKQVAPELRKLVDSPLRLWNLLDLDPSPPPDIALADETLSLLLAECARMAAHEPRSSGAT